MYILLLDIIRSLDPPCKHTHMRSASKRSSVTFATDLWWIGVKTAAECAFNTRNFKENNPFIWGKSLHYSCCAWWCSGLHCRLTAGSWGPWMGEQGSWNRDFLNVLLLSAQVSSGCSGFPPQSKDMTYELAISPGRSPPFATVRSSSPPAEDKLWWIIDRCCNLYSS